MLQAVRANSLRGPQHPRGADLCAAREAGRGRQARAGRRTAREFDRVVPEHRERDETATAQLAAAERRAAAAPGPTTARGRFAALLETLHARTGRPAVVLVDEYDRPILDALETPAVARANRDYLRGFYAVVKDSGEHVRFAFLTGVSKFSKVSLFSGLNNLTDITLDPRYSAVCGYTDADLDAVFAPELPGLDRQRIRDWYNGYCWLGEHRVYNPYDVLLLFDAPLRRLVVRDGHAVLSRRNAVQAPRQFAGAGRHGGQRRPAVEL